MGKVIVTAALTGVLATRDQCPAIPYTPKEIGEEAKRAADAGAAIVHIHARTPQGGPDWSLGTFAEIFDEVRARTDVGVLDAPYQFSLIMGVLGGIPGTTRHLVDQVDSLPQGSHWQVIGIGLNQWPLVASAIAMGGNVRVGLEDNFYLEQGKMAKSNGDLVEKATHLAHDLGREVASIAEAREQLSLSRFAGEGRGEGRAKN